MIGRHCRVVELHSYPDASARRAYRAILRSEGGPDLAMQITFDEYASLLPAFVGGTPLVLRLSSE